MIEIIGLPGCNRKKSDRTPLAFNKSKKKTGSESVGKHIEVELEANFSSEMIPL